MNYFANNNTFKHLAINTIFKQIICYIDGLHKGGAICIQDVVTIRRQFFQELVLAQGRALTQDSPLIQAVISALVTVASLGLLVVATICQQEVVVACATPPTLQESSLEFLVLSVHKVQEVLQAP